MAYNDSPDNEFDQEMERILQEHFETEESNLDAPADLWNRLESRLEEPANPSFFSRLLGMMNPLREGRLSPAFAVAGVAVVALAVAATVWAMSGYGGAEPPGGLALAPVTEESEGASLPTVAPAATSIPRSVEVTRIVEQVEQEVAEEQEAPAATTAPAPTSMAAAPTAAPAAAPAPAATTAPVAVSAAPTAAPQTSVVVEVTRVAEMMAMEDSSSAMATPAATTAPAAPTAVAGARGPRGESGPAGAQGGIGTPPDTTFRDYGRQPFVAASEDNVSTFSLDTDRTSYHLALNWARNGYEVDPDSVRAEEWLNAFDYQYDPPTGGYGFAITSGLYPHPLDESKRLARIAFQAREVADDRPLNVTLVLDASGSMADGNRVAIARAAAESIRRSLRPEDRIAVVHFTDDVIHQYTVEHRSPENERVRDSINWLQPHGSTNVQAGLNLGVELAAQIRDRRPDAHNYVILMSDGVANVDATDPFAILETAYDASTRAPLRLIAIGVGINNYNDVLLEQLAQHGNGWYRYLDSAAQAQATFSRENWLALSTPFADQTRAQVTWETATVKRWRIIGYENRVAPDETFTQARKEFAELYSGAATTVLYELELTEQAQFLTGVPLGQVELRWVDPAYGGARVLSAQLYGNPGAGFDGRDGSLAHFGAIAALSADLYSLLPNAPEIAYTEVHAGLSALLEQLRSLRGDLGMLDAYNDFLFLLEHITGDVKERMPPSTGSGYSR